ncbi:MULTISPECIES: hypothetical protein [unclassified Mycobacterium]|uniref:hypothetical protein n=1 Tax=unclassified Mycobacterium TaxID=2642494 RepID=UPI000AA0B5CC|nr:MULTISPECIES: hypothetical protein [unclassified Mycobacterium]
MTTQGPGQGDNICPADASDWIGPSDLFQAFADRLKFEHDIIGHRMGWLMTLNGFLVGAAALVLSNHTNVHEPALTATLLSICLAGAVSNISCCYSNYWSDVTIREAASGLDEALRMVNRRNGDLTDRVTEVSLEAYGRIFGRDPAAFRRKNRFHYWDLLHPWFLLPLLFVVAFCIAATFMEKITGASFRWWYLALPDFVTALFIALGTLAVTRYEADKKKHASHA